MTQFPAQQPSAVADDIPARPQQLRIAVNLMYVGAALAVMGGILTLIGVPATVATYSAQEVAAGRTPAEIQSTETLLRIFAMTVGIFTIVVGAGLWLWMARANSAGRPWARPVATILAGFGLILSVVNLAMPLLNMILAAITILLIVVVLVMLWSSSVSNYIALQKSRAH